MTLSDELRRIEAYEPGSSSVVVEASEVVTVVVAQDGNSKL